MSERLQKLLDKARSLPKGPGCYLMKDKSDKVIYVGKAKNLKNRVVTYFQKSEKNPKTAILVGHIGDLDFILTGNETEAFVLENNLIKKHRPKYNIMLRDDKSYPYVQINRNEPFPRLQYIRHPKKMENVKRFGPFVWGSRISEVISILTKFFGLRDCSLREYQQRKTPCLLYQMKQCTAPCVGYISTEDYEKKLSLVESFFSGKGEIVGAMVEQQMYERSKNEEFENAAMLRDFKKVLDDFLEMALQKNTELYGTVANFDIVAFYEGSFEVDLSIYMVRNDLLLGHKNYHFLSDDCYDETLEEVMVFLHQYYSTTGEALPEKIFMKAAAKKIKIFEAALNLSLNQAGKVEIESEAKLKSLYELTYNHSKETQRVRLENQESQFVALYKLKELLRLKERPRVLECYDVAVWQGKSPTAARVTFEEGRPNKKLYRHYHLSERPEGNNDFAMMEELLSRRFDAGDLPDLLVIDGGKAQVNTVLKVCEEKSLSIPVVGIAKSKNIAGTFKDRRVEKTDERLIIPGRSNPYILSKCPPLFRLLVQMRDEAHRFSRKLHHKEQKKKLLKSWWDEIPGIGPKTRKKIQENLDFPMNELKSYSVEQIKETLQVNKSVAQKLSDWLSVSN